MVNRLWDDAWSEFFDLERRFREALPHQPFGCQDFEEALATAQKRMGRLEAMFQCFPVRRVMKQT